MEQLNDRRDLRHIVKASLDERRWDDVVVATQDLDDGLRSAFLKYARATALLEIASPRAEEALEFAERGLEESPDSDWGNLQKFRALVALGRVDEAIAHMRAYRDRRSTAGRTSKLFEAVVDLLVECDRLDAAAEFNAERAVIAPCREDASYAVAVQCFTKADLLEETLAALARCAGAERFEVFVRQDGLAGLDGHENYEAAWAATGEVVGRAVPLLASRFAAVHFVRNRRNLGTAPTCRKLIDDACRRTRGFLFIEDDCVLSPDALEWTAHHLERTVSHEGVWFATCEATFFDSRGADVPADKLDRLRQRARDPELSHAYWLRDNVPSSCFATTRDIWKMCREARSFPRGPLGLDRLVRSLNRQVVAPIVPRVADLGMLHELGYSRTMYRKGNEERNKTVYLQADGPFVPDLVVPYGGDRGALFAETVLLE